MLNMFLDIVADPPQCLVWLPLMHRMASVEHGKQTNKHAHTHSASALNQHSFTGKTEVYMHFYNQPVHSQDPLVSKIFKFYLIYLLSLL